MKFKTLKTTTLLSSFLLVGVKTQELVTVNLDHSNTIGDILGYAIRIFQFFLIALLFLDLLMRTFGCRLGNRGIIHIYRAVIFIYLFLVPILADTQNLRGFAGEILSKGIFDKIHNGYFGLGYLKIFETDSISHELLMQNIVFVEILIYGVPTAICILLFPLIVCGLQSRIINFIVNLRLVIFISLFSLLSTKAASVYLIWYYSTPKTDIEDLQQLISMIICGVIGVLSILEILVMLVIVSSNSEDFSGRGGREKQYSLSNPNKALKNKQKTPKTSSSSSIPKANQIYKEMLLSFMQGSCRKGRMPRSGPILSIISLIRWTALTVATISMNRELLTTHCAVVIIQTVYILLMLNFMICGAVYNCLTVLVMILEEFAILAFYGIILFFYYDAEKASSKLDSSKVKMLSFGHLAAAAFAFLCELLLIVIGFCITFSKESETGGKENASGMDKTELGNQNDSAMELNITARLDQYQIKNVEEIQANIGTNEKEVKPQELRKPDLDA